ncbi:hypothetical protein [Buttiauxella gaviniae]|uniref:hypothetical protein n=1 Tax=Buttiauxella gaviniae TaxID=82990 RepID=UPI003975E01D
MDNHIKALNLFIETQKNIYKQRLKDFGCVGKISWDARQWLYGEKGVAWFREGGKGSLNFSCIGRMKGYSNIKIEKNYMDFMRAIIIAETFTTTTLPSGVALEKRLNVLKRWYYEMINTTGQSCPMYLSAEIIHSAMKRHKENSLSPANVSDYCDIAVLLSKRIKHLNIAITSLECKNLYPHRNSSSYTKQRKISEMDGEYTDDEKLITIRAFMCIIEMIYLSTTSGQKIFLNLLMLLIITGFRFREVQALKIDALIKRPIVGINARLLVDASNTFQIAYMLLR